MGLDDSALYCIEMTQKAFQAAGIELSKPIRLGDMERAPEFPLCMYGLRLASQFTLERVRGECAGGHAEQRCRGHQDASMCDDCDDILGVHCSPS